MLKNVFFAITICLTGAGVAQAADRFAVVNIVNTADIPLTFHYQIGNSYWLPVQLFPGQSYGISAGLTGPGIYQHAPIRITFDEDLTTAVNWRWFLPIVAFSPDEDPRRGMHYAYGYDGATRRFVEMYPVY